MAYPPAKLIIICIGLVRKWSLIAEREGGGGGATKWDGGSSEVLPLQKGGTENVLAILKGKAHKVSTL